MSSPTGGGNRHVRFVDVAEIVDDNDGEEEEEEEDTSVFLGSGEYQIVGIRYYRGVAHPGEFVELVREPRNPYDRNAIRLDNLRGEKIGHVKGTTARCLAPLMDASESLGGLEFYGSIPRGGNGFTLPLTLEVYLRGESRDRAPSVARTVAKALRNAPHSVRPFRPSSEFGGGGRGQPSPTSVAAVVTHNTKLDWNRQQKALDEMFDRALSEQYRDLPEDLAVPCLRRDVRLFDHQVKGIRWLHKRETEGSPAPFYRRVTENGREMHLCEITSSSRTEPPAPVRGALLCDAMGLGKTLVVIGLILSSPPAGVTYEAVRPGKKPTTAPGGDDDDDGSEKDGSAGNDDAIETPGKESLDFVAAPVPGEAVIRTATVATLKAVLRAAELRVSGKRADLVARVLDGLRAGDVTGAHFPAAVTRRPEPVPVPVATAGTGTGTSPSRNNRCTLIVCPVSVMSNWTDQLSNHVEDGVLSVELYHGPDRHDLLPVLESGKTIDVLLVSYHTLAAEYGAAFGGGDGADGDGSTGPAKKKSRRSSIFDISFHRIVLDEAVSVFCWKHRR